MSTPPEYVCKHCGSDDISAEVEARGWVGGYVAIHNDRVYFDTDGRPEYDDVDEIGYECGKCGKYAYKLADLVVLKQADGQLSRPCGRCDHSSLDHPQVGDGHRPDYVRPPMPCTVAGCDCHDFYDITVALAPNPAQLEIAA